MKFVSMIQIPASKVAERKENESLVKDFLKKGGVIQLKKPKRTANSHSWDISRMRGGIANR